MTDESKVGKEKQGHGAAATSTDTGASGKILQKTLVAE